MSPLDKAIAKASSPQTTRKKLWRLLCHPEAVVRRALLANPNLCSVNDQGKLNTRLIRTLAEEFPEEVATHPLFVLHAIVEPTAEMKGTVLEVAARTTNTGLIEQTEASPALQGGVHHALVTLSKKEKESEKEVRRAANKSMKTRSFFAKMSNFQAKDGLRGSGFGGAFLRSS